MLAIFIGFLAAHQTPELSETPRLLRLFRFCPISPCGQGQRVREHQTQVETAHVDGQRGQAPMPANAIGERQHQRRGKPRPSRRAAPLPCSPATSRSQGTEPAGCRTLSTFPHSQEVGDEVLAAAPNFPCGQHSSLSQRHSPPILPTTRAHVGESMTPAMQFVMAIANGQFSHKRTG